MSWPFSNITEKMAINSFGVFFFSLRVASISMQVRKARFSSETEGTAGDKARVSPLKADSKDD